MAATGIGLLIIWAGTRGPYEIFTMMKLFHQSPLGLKARTPYGTPYAATAFETEVIINALIYCACVLDPLLYFAINPDYRKGLSNAWKELYCNKDPVEVSRSKMR